MEKSSINLEVVEKVAKQLGPLNEKIVFVGGAIVSVYISDDGAEEVRSTDDIDFTIQLSNYSEWNLLLDELSKKGFSPNPFGSSICSYIWEGIEIDVMPSENSPIGESNTWYKPGFNSLLTIYINDQQIRVLSPPYFLATKFEAHKSRSKDPRTSHDLEDIIYVLNNREEIVEEIKNSDNIVKEYLIAEISNLLSNKHFIEIIQSHLQPSTRNSRLPILIQKLKAICDS